MRVIMLLVLLFMVASILSLLVLPNDDDQVPRGDPLEESLKAAER
jgi:hypothetical protein